MDKKRILICDDEEGIRESLNLILEEQYDLSFAASADEAVECVRQDPADLVILDIKMPKKSGIEALKEIRRLNPAVKVLMITGYRSVETATEAAKYGVSEYIAKPFDSDQVRQVIAKILL